MSVLKVGAIQPNSGTKVNITGSTLLVTTASGHFSGSYEGDGSRLEGVAGFPFTGSGQISGSLLVTGSSALAVRVSGSTALTGSLFVSGAVSSSVGFSGSFQGDGSSLTGLATNLTVDGDSGTQDVSLTADDLQILGTANEISTAVTKVSNDVKVTLGLPDTVAVTASVATRANALAPTVTATSASVAARATTLSAQATASFADVAGTVHNGNITNAKLANDSVTIGSTEIDLGATATTLTGLTSISATTASFVLQTFESSSTVITSGSNIFGDKANDIQQITGSLLQTGSMTVIGNISASVGGFSGSFQGDGTLLTGVIASGSIQSASVATRADTLSPAATAASSSTAILAQTASVAGRANDLAPTVTATSASTAVAAQTASVAGRANDLAPTVTATSASTAVLAQTASVATRANALAPTVTATSASVAARATTLSPAATASFADKADEAVTSNVIPVTVVDDGGNKYAFNGVTAPKISLNRGELYRFDLSDSTNNGHPLRFRLLDDTAFTPGVNAVGTPGQAGAYVDFDVNFATSASLKYYCTAHGNGMGNRAQIVDVLNGITSGSFSGSYEGDGSSLTGISSYAVANSANNRVITSVDSENGNAEANLLFDGSTLSVSGSHKVSGSLLVTGSSTLALRVSGSSALTGSLLVSGSTSLSGSLITSGSNILSGSLLQSGSTQITGSTLLSGSLLLTGSSALALRVSGSTALTGSLFVSGTVSGSFIGNASGLTGVSGFPHTGSADISGSLLVTGSAFVTSLTETSALRYKKSVKNIDNQANAVYQLRPVHFRWRDNNKKDFGLIAEEVQEIYPELVTNGQDGNALGISYTKLTALLLKTIQDLNERIEKLENKN